MSSPTNPDEPTSPSTRPPERRDEGPSASEPPPTDPQRPSLCPRCGGEAHPRKRRSLRANPFLSNPPPKAQVTCVDCGLDLELGAEAAPWEKAP